jgi:AraC-like DNA-binding protein
VNAQVVLRCLLPGVCAARAEIDALRARLDASERRVQTLEDVIQRSKTISGIAFEWGFNSITHFGRVFRERFGVAPSSLHRSGNPRR